MGNSLNVFFVIFLVVFLNFLGFQTFFNTGNVESNLFFILNSYPSFIKLGGIKGREGSSNGFSSGGGHSSFQGRSLRDSGRSRGRSRCSRAPDPKLQTIIECSETDSPDGVSNTGNQPTGRFSNPGGGLQPGPRVGSRGPTLGLFTRSRPNIPTRRPYSGILLTSGGLSSSGLSSRLGQTSPSSHSTSVGTRGPQSGVGSKFLSPGYGSRPGSARGPTFGLFTRSSPTLPTRRPYSGSLLTSSSLSSSNASGGLGQSSHSSRFTSTGTQGPYGTSGNRFPRLGRTSSVTSGAGTPSGQSVSSERIPQGLQARGYMTSNCPRGIPGEHRVDITSNGSLICCYCYNRCDHEGFKPPRRTTTTTTQSPPYSSRGYLTSDCPLGIPGEHRLDVTSEGVLFCATCGNKFSHQGCPPPKIPKCRKKT
ncbi:signal peptide-containing protein [Cryptosporidium hominis]